MAARKSRKTSPRADAWLDLEAQGSTLSPVYDPARGLGLETRYTSFRRIREIGSEEVKGLYSDGIGRRIVELPIGIALKDWPALDVAPEYQEAADRVAEAAEALEAQRWITRAATWARRDGWALSVQAWAALAGEGLQPWSEPRAPVGSDCVWVRPAYRWDCSVPSSYFGVDSRHFGSARWLGVHRMRPDVESDTGYLAGSDLGSVHGTRFTRLSTTTGRTEYERVAQYLAQLLAGGGGVAGALSRANVGVFSIPDWAQKVRRNDAEAYGRIRAHFEALSSFAPLVLDAGSNGKGAESFELLANGALGGTENALFALSWLVSAASGIPMLDLFGLEPGGFSSGEETTRRWHDSLEQTRRWVEPAIRSLYDGLWARELGRPMVPAYRLVWAPLRSPTLDERASSAAAVIGVAERSLALGLTTPEAVRSGLAATPDLDLWAWQAEAALEPIEASPTEGSEMPLSVSAAAAAETALNGAQTAAFVQVLGAVGAGQLSPVAAEGLLRIAFPAAPEALIRQVVQAQVGVDGAAQAAGESFVKGPPIRADDPTAPEIEDADADSSAAPLVMPPPGTWLEAEEAAERCGIAPKKIKSLGSRGIVHRRKLGSRWEYRLEDLIEVAAAAVEGPSVAEESGPVTR